MSDPPFSLVVIGVSTGGVDALQRLLGGLSPTFPLPVAVVAHISPDSGDGLPRLLDDLSPIRVREGGDFVPMDPGVVFIAPPGYHLLVDREGFLTLSLDPPECHARPSIDVLFESAAYAFGRGVVGVILTGAGFDGARGLSLIARRGGVTVVQDPEDAVADLMPRAACAATTPDYVAPLVAIPRLITEIVTRRRKG